MSDRLSPIGYQLSAISQRGAISYQLSAREELSAVGYQLSAREELSAVGYQLSAISYQPEKIQGDKSSAVSRSEVAMAKLRAPTRRITREALAVVARVRVVWLDRGEPDPVPGPLRLVLVVRREARVIDPESEGVGHE